MTPSRAAVGRVGEEARGSRAGSGVQELRRQGGEDKGQGGGRVGRGFPAPRTAVLELGALQTGCNKQLGETGCVF